ncbi:MAG: sulfite exporter TauE/SafE family protein [Legionellales bacterium]|jgi:hypothetical protein
MEITDAFLLFIAGVIGGALNAVVGGGAFIAFPALIFLGVPPIQANATMTVSLWPGTLASLWAQRRELLSHTQMLPLFIPLSLLGGGIGAFTLITLSNSHFALVVPYMLLLATLVFTFQRQLIDWSTRQHWHISIWIPLLVIAIYGGFFGAGMGIMFLAFLGIIGMKNMHEANALRNCSTACINSIASFIFIISDKVVWTNMLMMCAGAIVGGYFCAHYARKLSSELLRIAVMITAWIMTVYFFWKYLLEAS